MNRKTFLHVRQSSIPESIGLCASDSAGLAKYINEAQERLMVAGGETGWYGTWQKVAFTVDPDDPCLTLPRQIARIINLDVCRFPVRVQNEFYEFLESGIGLQPSSGHCSSPVPCSPVEAFDRGNAPLFRDLDATGNPKKLRFYPFSDRDYGRKVLVQGLDINGSVVRSLANGVDVEGEYVLLNGPFVDTAYAYSAISGMQKDVTAGDVRVYEVDSVTGSQRAISIMEPSETVAWYRRYFINGICHACCAGDTESACLSAPSTASVVALCKLELIPVSVDTDYLLIGNLSALKQECMAIRYESSDSENALAMADRKHKQAIRILNNELIHYTGRERPAIHFAPFGNAKLENKAIGTLT